MKYIRTKDGRIFDVSEICIPYQIVDGWIDFNSQGRFEIAKETDTIEELCDKFVWIDNEYRRGFICNIEFVKNCTKSHEGRLYGDSKFIFGAIWTDKGLIYVAKMNGKGELELL